MRVRGDVDGRAKGGRSSDRNTGCATEEKGEGFSVGIPMRTARTKGVRRNPADVTCSERSRHVSSARRGLTARMHSAGM